MGKRNEFFDNLSQCSTGERAVLRRNCGTLLQRADGKAKLVFYRILPYGVSQDKEKIWFAAACFCCIWKPEQKGRPMAEVLGQLEKKSESMHKRLETLLDLEWDEDGYMLTKLTRIIRMAESMGYPVDCADLLQDLLEWDNGEQSVQRKWAMALQTK